MDEVAHLGWLRQKDLKFQISPDYTDSQKSKQNHVLEMCFMQAVHYSA